MQVPSLAPLTARSSSVLMSTHKTCVCVCCVCVLIVCVCVCCVCVLIVCVCVYWKQPKLELSGGENGCGNGLPGLNPADGASMQVCLNEV